MGVVYGLVRNSLMGASRGRLKVIGGHMVERPGVRATGSSREVRSAAKLQHRNIVTAYSAIRGWETALRSRWSTSRGDDLANVITSGGPMQVINACYVVYQAAPGLQHAHERGMVHRDTSSRLISSCLAAEKK